MGAYHIFVNPAKQEYLDPTVFGDGNKHGALFNGLHRYALKLLFYSPDLTCKPINDEVSTWTGDPLYIAADDDNPTPATMEHLKSIVGETDDHNLYWHARYNYTDVSQALLKHLLLVVRNEDFLTNFYERAKVHTHLFQFLASTYYETKHTGLKIDLEQHFGKNWSKR